MDRTIPCKIGTVPKVIHAIDGRCTMEVGRVVRIKERQGSRWQTVRITRIDPNGYFMADWF